MTESQTIIQKVRRSVQQIAFGNVLYDKILSQKSGSGVLRYAPDDLWPGNALAGSAMLSAQKQLFIDQGEQSFASRLRDLREEGSDGARIMALSLIQNWLRYYDTWREAEWSPANLGERISCWIGFYNFYIPASDDAFQINLVTSLYRQYRHLLRVMDRKLNGLARLQAIKGLVYGGINFDDGDKAIALACDLLQRQLQEELLPDGGHGSRNPSVQLHIVRHLCDVRAALESADIEPPIEIRMALEAMVPSLRLLKHGDHRLALFHGGAEESSKMVEAVLATSGVRARHFSRLPYMGYERMSAGRSVLIADAGAPPESGFGDHAHSGLLAFEFSHGRHKIITNCGAIKDDEQWRKALSATAAHSTITVNDTNACHVGGKAQASKEVHVEVQRYEQDGTQFMDLRHDGYADNFSLMMQRIFKLLPGGDGVEGREILKGKPGSDFVVRWHIHPDIQISLSQNGSAAFLRDGGGQGWRLQVDAGTLGLEPSVYCGTGTPRRSQQITLTDRMAHDRQNIVWTLMKEKRL